MSESQSRYSIVERLTRSKLQVMEKKSKLSEEIIIAEQKATELEKDIEHDKKICQQEADKQKEEYDKALRDAKTKVINLKAAKETQEKLCDDGIKIIDDALNKLEEISKSSQS